MPRTRSSHPVRRVLAPYRWMRRCSTGRGRRPRRCICSRRCSGAQARTAQAMHDLFGVAMSAGAVAAAHTRAGDLLTDSEFVDQVRDMLTGADVVHVDESGLRVAGKLHWVHVATTGKYTLIWVHPKRGRVGTDAGQVMASHTGIVVHDAWAPYDTYPLVVHQLCCAHLLRELTAAGGLAPDAV